MTKRTNITAPIANAPIIRSVTMKLRVFIQSRKGLNFPKPCADNFKAYSCTLSGQIRQIIPMTREINNPDKIATFIPMPILLRTFTNLYLSDLSAKNKYSHPQAAEKKCLCWQQIHFQVTTVLHHHPHNRQQR